jgi:hypothetical protein
MMPVGAQHMRDTHKGNTRLYTTYYVSHYVDKLSELPKQGPRARAELLADLPPTSY